MLHSKAMFLYMIGLLHPSLVNAKFFDTRVTRGASIMEIFPDGASLRTRHFVGFSEGSPYNATFVYLTYKKNMMHRHINHTNYDAPLQIKVYTHLLYFLQVLRGIELSR